MKLKFLIDKVVSKFVVRSYHFVAVPTKEYYKCGNYINSVTTGYDPSHTLHESKRFGRLYRYKRDKAGIISSEIEMHKIKFAEDIKKFEDERRGVVAASLSDINKEYKIKLREQIMDAMKEVRDKEVTDGKVQNIR